MTTQISILLALAYALGPGVQTDEKADEILSRASQVYEKTVTLRSEFVQKIEIRALEREKEGRGVVFQKKPNYFLMKFEDPEGDIIVADGQWFWMYYPSAQPDQVIRTPIGETTESATLGGQFLNDPSTRYVSTYVEVSDVGGRPAHLISLVPKFDAPYTLVRVWIDTKDYLVRKFQVYEQNETIRTITLSNVQAGVDLPDDLFVFTLPSGVEVFTR